MRFIADFHIHSKYSRATSKEMNLESLSHWAKIKGIGLLGTGDFTHPQWNAELHSLLKPAGDSGLYTFNDVNFILSCEISCIYKQNGKVYRIHNIFMVPSLKKAKAIMDALDKIGNVKSDGRPIFGLNCMELCQLIFNEAEDAMLIPAHIWTPWFSLFGSKSGFDMISDAFGKYTDKVTALETGLSSDPAMNWRFSQLDPYSLVSNSDSHSPNKIGREANIFDCDLNYWEIKDALEKKDQKRFIETIEFYPEEGKYHHDGHRKCDIVYKPEETSEKKGICPMCGKKLTVGVLNRVVELADRPEGYVPKNAIPFRYAVPLEVIISQAMGFGVKSKKVQKAYQECIDKLGPELAILLDHDEEKLRQKLVPQIVTGIMNVRNNKVSRSPGYDGEYGVIKVF